MLPFDPNFQAQQPQAIAPTIVSPPPFIDYAPELGMPHLPGSIPIPSLPPTPSPAANQGLGMKMPPGLGWLEELLVLSPPPAAIPAVNRGPWPGMPTEPEWLPGPADLPVYAPKPSSAPVSGAQQKTDLVNALLHGTAEKRWDELFNLLNPLDPDDRLCAVCDFISALSKMLPESIEWEGVQSLLRRFNEFHDLRIGTLIDEYKKDPIQATVRYLKGIKTKSHLEACLKDTAMQFAETLKDALLTPNLKQIAHLFADFCIKDSHLEGMHRNEAAAYLLSFLEHPSILGEGLLDHPDVKSAICILKSYKDWVDRLAHAKQDLNYLNPISHDMVKELNAAGRLLFPLGWTGYRGGHSMLGEVILQGSACTLTVYNTGCGLQNHQGRWIGNKLKYYPKFTIRDIRPQEIATPVFFTTILGMMKVIPPKAEDCFKGNDIYGFLKTALGGNVCHFSNLNDEEFMSPQQSGTCSWKVLMAYLRTHMPRQEYLKFKFKMRLYSYTLFLRNQANEVVSPWNYWFYEDVRKKFGRHAVKLFQKGIISDQEFLLAASILHTKYAKQGNQQTLEFDSCPLRNLSYASFWLEGDVRIALPNASKTLLENTLKPLDGEPPIAGIADGSAPEKLLGALKSYCDFGHELKEQGREKQLELFLNRVLLSLPNLGAKSSIMKGGLWGKLQGPAAYECSNYVHGLATLLLSSNASKTSDGIIHSFYLCAVMFILVRNGLQAELNGHDIFDRIYPWNWDLTQEFSFLVGPFTHPSLMLRLAQMLIFFKNHAPKAGQQTEGLFFFPGASHSYQSKDKTYFAFSDLDAKCAIVDRYLEKTGKSSEIPKGPQRLFKYLEIYRQKQILPKAFWNYFELYLGAYHGVDLLNHNITMVPYQGQEGKEKITGILRSDNENITKSLTNLLLSASKGCNTDRDSYPNIHLLEHLYGLEKNPQVLVNPDSRNRLFNILFGINCAKSQTTTFFETEMEVDTSRLVIKKLHAILQELTTTAVLNNNTAEFLFVCKLEDHIREYLAYLQRQSPKSDYPVLEDIVKKADLLKIYESSQKILKLQCAYEYLKLSKRHAAIDGQWLKIAVKALALGASAFSNHECYLLIWSALREKMQDCQTIYHAMSDGEKHLFIKDILQSCRLQVNEQSAVEGSWPNIHCNGFDLDLSTGFIKYGNKAITINVEFISNHPGFQSALSDDNEKPALFLEGSQYTLQDQSLLIKFLDSGERQPLISISNERLLKKAASYETPINPNTLCPQGYLYLPPPTQHGKTYPQELRKLDLTLYKDIPQALWHPRFERWVSQSTHAPHLFLFDQRSKRILCIFLENLRTLVVRDLTNDRQLIPSNIVKSDPATAYALCKFTNVEYDSHMLIWQHRTTQVFEFELLRYGLYFESQSAPSGHIRFACREHPGFYLCTPPDSFKIPNFQPVIYLKNDKNQYRLILPKIKFKRKDVPADPLNASTVALLNNTIIESFKCAVLNHDADSTSISRMASWNGPKEDLAIFVRALIYSKNYRHALDHIRKLYTTEIDKSALEILQDILKQEREQPYHHPHYYALIVHIMWLVCEITKHEGVAYSNVAEFSEIYNAYISKYSNIDLAFRLPEDKEQAIHRILFNPGNFYAQRLNKLQHFRNVHQAANLSVLDYSIQEKDVYPSGHELILFAPQILPDYSYNPLPAPQNLSEVYALPFNIYSAFYSLVHEMLLAIQSNDSDRIQSVLYRAYLCQRISKTSNDFCGLFSLLARKPEGLDKFLIKHKSLLGEKIPSPQFKDLVKSLMIEILKPMVSKGKAKQSKKRSKRDGPTPLTSTPAPGAAKPEPKKRPLEEIPNMPIGLRKNGRVDVQAAESTLKTQFIPFEKLYANHIIASDRPDIAPMETDTLPLVLVLRENTHMKALFQDPIALMLLEKISKDYREIKHPVQFRLRDKSALPGLKLELQADFNTTAREAEALFHKMIASLQPQLNEGEPAHDLDISGFAVKLMGFIDGQSPEIRITTLIDSFLKAGKALPEEYKNILKERLSQAIKLCLKNRMDFQALKLCSLIEQNDQTTPYSNAEQELGQLLSVKMPDLSPDSGALERAEFFFQLMSNKFLRPRQADVLQKCNSTQKIALQMGCGEGKTKVITVVLSLDQILKDRSVVNLVPQANLETNYEDLRQFFTEHTDLRPKRFSFSRKSNIRYSAFEHYVHDIIARGNEGLLVADPKSIQSVQLRYFETLLNPKADDKTCHQFEAILEHFMDNTTAVLDEVHIILKALHYLNYAMADEMVLPSYRWEIPCLIFQAMMDANASPETSGKFPIAGDSKTPWTPDDYHQRQKPLLAKILGGLLVKEKVITPEEAGIFAYFLCCNRAGLAPEERFKLQEWINAKPQEHQELLKLSRAHLNVYLPHTLNARCEVHYGPSKDVEYAIPYNHNMSASENSAFENYDVMVNFTYQLYLQKGLSKSQVKDLLQNWQTQDRQERAAGLQGMQAQFGETYIKAPLFALKLDDEETLNDLHQTFSKNTKAVFEYLQNFLFPEVKVQISKLSSSSQDLAGILFTKIIAFSGTLMSNYLTLPQDMRCLFDDGADGEAISSFLHGGHAHIELVDSLNFKDLLQQPRVCMVLDPHAYLEGWNNESVADLLLKSAPERITHINYFDSKTNLMTAKTRDGASNSQINKMENICHQVTYCDQEHTTGTDTVQPENGIGLLLANKGLTMTELFQSAKRLRSFGKGQQVQIVIPNEIAALIRSGMHVSEVDMETLLLWCLHNEAQQLSNSLYASFQQQVHAVFRRRLMRKLIAIKNQPIEPHEKMKMRRKLVEEYKPLIVEEVNNREFLEHGSIDLPITPLQALEDLTVKYKDSYGKILDTDDRNELEEILKKARSRLRHTYEQTVDDLLDKSAQREQQAQKEVQDQFESMNSLSFANDWDLRIFESQVFKTCFVESSKGDPFSISSEQLDQKESHLITMSSPMLYLEPYARILPEIFVDKAIYATNNFLHLRSDGTSLQQGISPAAGDKVLTDLFRKKLPAVRYLLAIYSGPKAKKYVVITPAEADKIRSLYLGHRVKIKPIVRLHLYNLEGEQLASVNKTEDPDDPDKDLPMVIAQLKFINGDTLYQEKLTSPLKHWLGQSHTAAKVAFFQEMHRLRSLRRLNSRSLKGTMIQQIFDEVQPML